MKNMGRNIDGLIPCPVCGTAAFEELGDYDICPICGWENEEPDMRPPERSGGPNGMSLNQARAMWAEGKRVWSPED